MRCTSFCTAGGYKLAAITDFFKAKRYVVTAYRNVLHVTKPNNALDLFFFSNGCLVSWGVGKKREQKLLEQIKLFSIDPLDKIEVDRFIYQLGTDTKISSHPRFKADIITIALEEEKSVPLKLAISYGLVQSVKLEAYEESIQKTVDNNRRIPNQLAKSGYISLSRRSISKRIGEIFIERSSVNLSSEYFDVPEYFWEYSNLETYYTMTEQFLDVPKRVAALNRRLDVLHEMFDMLNNQLQHRYSSMLETVIILLIAIEIVISLLHR
jgi:uncharacterized Rmd1/YagE family protein